MTPRCPRSCSPSFRILQRLQKPPIELRAKLASLPEPTGANLWPKLRRQLEAAALIEPESIPGVRPPYLRFHPTLAPMLWAQLDKDEKARLAEAYRRRYHALAGYLYREDTQNPDQARAIARRELPNLLHALRQALDVSDADAVDFVNFVNRFLNGFGMTREAALLRKHAEKLGSEKGSKAWYRGAIEPRRATLPIGRDRESRRGFFEYSERAWQGSDVRPCYYV